MTIEIGGRLPTARYTKQDIRKNVRILSLTIKLWTANNRRCSLFYQRTSFKLKKARSISKQNSQVFKWTKLEVIDYKYLNSF